MTMDFDYSPARYQWQAASAFFTNSSIQRATIARSGRRHRWQPTQLEEILSSADQPVWNCFFQIAAARLITSNTPRCAKSWDASCLKSSLFG
jgi:hypothetical protein